MEKKDYFESTTEKNEFSDDIVFARFINYMEIALYHKRIDYNKHQEFLKQQEKSVRYEEWAELTNNVVQNTPFCDDYQKMKKALKKLTEKQKNVIIGYYYKNQSISEIAKELDTTDNAIKQLKLRAILSLKRYMDMED